VLIDDFLYFCWAHGSVLAPVIALGSVGLAIVAHVLVNKTPQQEQSK
jgi:hypothetical protein